MMAVKKEKFSISLLDSTSKIFSPIYLPISPIQSPSTCEIHVSSIHSPLTLYMTFCMTQFGNFNLKNQLDFLYNSADGKWRQWTRHYEI